MITVTQGLGTSQLPLQGFGDNFTHSDAPVTTEIIFYTYLTKEALPSAGAPIDGAWTETGQDGVWTENVGFAMSQNIHDGAYTQNDMFVVEAKPNVFGGKEGVPAAPTTTTEGKPQPS